ncbi:MAG: Txe/YoeB family addiction module toxin [Bacteroidales bacterium]|nr:Txe/YoeB family addiction module toxin [Bacteroidales bacterium]MCF8343796.1 Txe/YoeB family addiction module toxin [Bacteroidales bacterium]MCF8376745.1 Txe/YoeB family addiction module toxin [Bacteroidales bacterium]
MEIDFLDKAQEDLDFWKKSGNKTIQKRITKLLNSISKTPFSGIGKPEPLKHELKGYWSRRITEEHRLVYTVKNDRIKVISLRFHYI